MIRSNPHFPDIQAMPQRRSRPPASFRRDLRAGLVIVAPIAVTGWALLWLFRLVDGFLGRVIGPFLPIPLPGLGLLLLLLGLIGVGALSRSRFGVALILWLDQRLSRIPLASWVYGTATQITHSTLDAQSGTFKRCVLVEYPKANSWAMGFVTAAAPDTFREGLGIPDLVAVFVPTTPNPTSGFLLMVPESATVETGIPPETGFRLIISAGAIRIDAADAETPRRTLAEFLERL